MAHLKDMEELLSTISSTETRDYMREAMNCYMASAYRGCIVLSYIALFDDLLTRLDKLGSVNSSAKAIHAEASKRKIAQDVYEGYLIEQLTSKNLLSGLDGTFLNTLRNLRNKSAHPSGHTPSAEEARFIFSETISRFLSKPILSTTQLVDEIIGRLGNANFFPNALTPDMKIVVSEAISTLHEEALPQLVSKLISSITSADTTVQKNANFFIIGLALQDQVSANKHIQSLLLSNKSDDSQYSELLLQTLAANGKLINGLTPACIGRIRSVLSRQIEQITAATSELKLHHPAHVLKSISKAMGMTDFISTFNDELKKLFEKFPYSNGSWQWLASQPSLFPIYFPIILAQAGSTNYNISNPFAYSVHDFDSGYASLCTDEQAFKIIIAMMVAARYGKSFGAQDHISRKFVNIPLLKSKALAYIESNKISATEYVSAKLPWTESIDNFILVYFTENEQA